MPTRAAKFLKQKRIPFEIIEYEHEEKGAVFAARAIGFPLEQTIKTLVADLGNKKYALALMPGDKHLSLKHLARSCSVKKAAMADTATAERLTGYFVGGISPFGTKQRLSVVMEERLTDYDEIVINAGQRGVMLKMTPDDIIKALNCKVADLKLET
ncbi:Cys-tRNA(Pro) deacylase [Desulfonema magnum]|uniref:Cys-tRNA(Pro)/Cys-tRNA(Cys) deacylase n=1 Tax=Desulfonema magnum TaxID=45655 RepID=A0A975BGH8_9BACT|nr:Cys-tRNA(Pro) deacylase [Desulfonema magnum]QTA85087.1 Cys-tRNA(Pro)/Cys-tRNA(Cys) deacylase [Desulfonema magnum]